MPAIPLLEHPWFESGTDAFGIQWIVDGMRATPDTRQDPVLEDIADWESVVRFPDISGIDISPIAAMELKDIDRKQKALCFYHPCGVFERLEALQDKYRGKLAIEGFWDTQGIPGQAAATEEDVRAGEAKPFSSIMNALQAIAQQVEDAGGAVGHIKATVQSSGRFAHASAVDAPSGVSGEGDILMDVCSESQTLLAAIALHIDQSQLEHAVQYALNGA